MSPPSMLAWPTQGWRHRCRVSRPGAAGAPKSRGLADDALTTDHQRLPEASHTSAGASVESRSSRLSIGPWGGGLRQWTCEDGPERMTGSSVLEFRAAGRSPACPSGHTATAPCSSQYRLR